MTHVFPTRRSSVLHEITGECLQAGPERGAPADRPVEHAEQQYRGRDRCHGRLRLGGAGYRAFAERTADGAAAAAGHADRCQYGQPGGAAGMERRSEEHTSELQSLMRISYAVFCLKKKKT